MSVGGLGAHRNPQSKELFLTADVIIGIDIRFEEMEADWREGFLPVAGSTYVQIDIDPAEHGRFQDCPRTDDCDRKEERKALDASGFAAHPGVACIRDAVTAIESDAEKIAGESRVPIHALSVIRAARETTVGIDVTYLAQHIAGATRYFRVFAPRSLVVPSNFYGMGFVASGFSAGKLVYPDRPALCFVGDRSFQMVMNNLATAVEHGLPVT